MKKTMIQGKLIEQAHSKFTVVRGTEDEVMEQITDYIRERYPWAVEKYHLEESLDYFLEAYDMHITMNQVTQ